jgi:hypothetical protein
MRGESRVKSLTAKDGALFDIYGREILDGSDYFHPNQVRGIPVFSVDTLMDQHKGYIKKIVRYCGVGDHHRTEDGLVLNDELYVEVIRRYIEYVHLLPASESHHHSVPGGLLIHSFEVSEIAFKIADNMKPEATGMLDIDKRLEPAYKYAAWLGGLLHDAGKVVSDMTIHAVSTYDKATESDKKVSENIPTWQPERESLISWARRFSVATYSVTFKKDRIHNQHNFDTSVLFSPIIGHGAALDKLLTKPINIRNELTKVLSGFESKCEYLKKAIRVGDNKSTGENLKVYQHLKLGPGKLSNAAMIYRAIQWSRPAWVINKAGGHAWVIGDDVYLRYTSAFDVIQKEAEEHGYHVTNKSQGLLDVMGDDNMIEKYDKDNWAVKYVGGVFTENDIKDIRAGKRTVGWESVIKVVWRGIIFDSDPVPDSAPGIMLLPDTEDLILVRNDGTTQLFSKPVTNDVNDTSETKKTKSNVRKEQVRQPVVIDNVKESPTDKGVVKPIEAPKSKAPTKVKEEVKAVKPKPKPKTLNFKNDPNKKKIQNFKSTSKKASLPSSLGKSLSADVIQFWEKAVFIKNPPKGAYLVHLYDTAELLDMTIESLALKAKEDGVIVPSQSAPLKVVTIHNNEPCLHVSVPPLLVNKVEPVIEPVVETLTPAREVEEKAEEKPQKKTSSEVGDASSFWLKAKEAESDRGLSMVVAAAKSKHTLGHAISVVLSFDLGGRCFIQTDKGLLVDVSKFSKALLDTNKYRTQARTIYSALMATEIKSVPEHEHLYVIPYEQLNSIKLRLRAA